MDSAYGLLDRPIPLHSRTAAPGWAAPASPQPADQADGLRRIFHPVAQRCLPLAANPHVGDAGVVLERLTAALSARGLRTLVVDAAAHSPSPHELAPLELRDGIEDLSPQVQYLAARGLPLRHVDVRGTCTGFLQALADAAPQAQVVLVHADAAELARIFARMPARPLLLAATGRESVTHAYAAMKLLAQRCRLMTFDLLLASPPGEPLARQVAASLRSCAESFMGAWLHDWAAVDPACDVRDPPSPAMARLVAAQLQLLEGEAAAPLQLMN